MAINIKKGDAGATASWSAPVLWRFDRDLKAAEDCRTPKPRGMRRSHNISNRALSRRDDTRVARRFNAGCNVQISSPEGTAENPRAIQSSLRDFIHLMAEPGVETPGYYQTSFLDDSPARN